MAVPALVQHVHSSNMLTGIPTVTDSTFNVFLPNPTGSGNCIVICYFTDNTGTPVVTATDDAPGGSNTYVNLVNGTDTHANQHGIIVATNVTAGAQHIAIKFTGQQSFHCCHVSEFYNVSTAAPATAKDGSNFNSTTGATSITAGNITPGTSGDLFVQAMTNGTVTGLTSIVAGSQSNITWALLGADRINGSAVQWGVYNSTSTLNPTMTTSSTDYGSVAVALKSASAGTALSAGMKIRKVLHNSFFSTTFSGPGYANPTTIQIPCIGDSLVGVIIGGGAKITSITGDSNGNTWANIGTEVGSLASTSQMFTVTAAVTSQTQTITVNFPDVTHDFTLLVYDISGGNQSALFDVAGVATGTTATLAASITGAAVTPTTANGVVIGTMGIDNNTIIGTTTTSGLFDSHYDQNETEPNNLDQNNGWAHVYNPNLATITFVFSPFLNSSAQGAWASLAASFKAAPVVSNQATTTTPYIGLWSKDGVLAVGAFDVGIPINFGLFDDGYVAQFSGTVYAANANRVRSVPICVFDRDADVTGMLGVF